MPSGWANRPSHKPCTTLKHSSAQKKHLPQSPHRWDRSPASEGRLPQGAAWLGGRPAGKWSYIVWLKHPPLGWSDLKLLCPGEEGAKRGTSMSEHISSCAVNISPSPSPPQPSLRCHLTPPMSFHIHQQKSLGPITWVNYQEDDYMWSWEIRSMQIMECAYKYIKAINLNKNHPLLYTSDPIS